MILLYRYFLQTSFGGLCLEGGRCFYISPPRSNTVMRDTSKIFCISQPFSICGNTVAPKLRAYVTESIPSAYAKFCSNHLKLTQ